jgi:hypothetical protein
MSSTGSPVLFVLFVGSWIIIQMSSLGLTYARGQSREEGTILFPVRQFGLVQSSFNLFTSLNPIVTTLKPTQFGTQRL